MAPSRQAHERRGCCPIAGCRYAAVKDLAPPCATTPVWYSGMVSRLHGKPNQLAVGDEQCRPKEEQQDSDDGPIFRTAKMRGYCPRHVERKSDRCQWREQRQRMHHQRNEKANSATHLKDTKQAKVPRLKFPRPACGRQCRIFGVGYGELGQSTHGEEESKENLKDCDDGLHDSIHLSWNRSV